ncbi:MAG: hypothetical protein A2Y61_00015 [Chloroflexi bacterium RBG_13_60_13]|nr:MAG: hypothetical protein A2Y61_00015 [Chloroflexi bacterium RBG_13_60_13]
MPRNTKPDPIVQRYVDYLNRLFNSTISQSRLVFLERAGELRLITRYQAAQIFPLELRPEGYLHLLQLVRRVRNHVEVQEARYVFSESDNPDDETAWIWRYDYERQPQPGKPQSHFHINAERHGMSLKHVHFPTGRISIEQIIAHLVTEYNVTSDHPNTFDFLRESHRGFLARRTDIQTDAFP